MFEIIVKPLVITDILSLFSSLRLLFPPEFSPIPTTPSSGAVPQMAAVGEEEEEEEEEEEQKWNGITMKMRLLERTANLSSKDSNSLQVIYLERNPYCRLICGTAN